MTLREYRTAAAVAELLGVRQGKVLAWIQSGELRAADLSEKPGTGRARWKISKADLDDFLRGRQPSPPKATRRKRKTKRPAGWVEYV